MMCLAVYAPSPSDPFGASASDFVTVNLPPPSSVALPQMMLILFFFIRNPTPPLSRFTTARERAITAFGSNETLSADRP